MNFVFYFVTYTGGREGTIFFFNKPTCNALISVLTDKEIIQFIVIAVYNYYPGKEKKVKN